MRRVLAILAAIVAALAMLAAQPPRAHAALVWTMTASPLAVSTGVATTYTLVATNGDLLTEIGCVVLDVPANFTVSAASISSSTAGDSWTTSRSGNRVVAFTTSGGDRLELLDSVTFRVTATAMSANSLAWSANAYRQQDCSGTGSLLGVPPIVVVTGATVTPTPMPTPVPTAVPTPTPTSTPVPTATSTAPTPRPTSTPATVPSATAAGSSAGTRSPRPAGSPEGSRTPNAAGSEPPVPRASADASTAASATASPGGAPGTTGNAGGSPRGPITARDPLDAAIQVGGMELLSGIEVWAIPAATLSVPGLLVLLWVAIQAGGSLAWLPAVRRLRGERRS